MQFYFDAVNGSDVTGDGSLEKPYRTLKKADEMLKQDVELDAEIEDLLYSVYLRAYIK